MTGAFPREHPFIAIGESFGSDRHWLINYFWSHDISIFKTDHVAHSDILRLKINTYVFSIKCLEQT